MENVVLRQGAQSPADRKLMRRQEKKGRLAEGKTGTRKEKKNFRATVVDITEFRAFSDSDFLSLWSFHGGLSSGLWWSVCLWESVFL